MAADFNFENQGTIMLIRCRTDAAVDWLDGHCNTEEYQWLGNHTLVVEPRYAQDIHTGMIDAGFTAD